MATTIRHRAREAGPPAIVPRDARETLVAVATILLLALVAHLPHILFERSTVNLDFQAHYRWSIEVARAMAAGDPWPRWMPLAWRGLGEPALLYYAPLYYLLTGLVRPFVGNIWAAMHVVEVASTCMCGGFAYRLVRAYAGRREALMGAALAVLNPLAVMLFEGFNGFPWATTFAPASYLFWAMLRPGARAPNVHAMVALALVIMMHTVSGLLCMAALAPLAFVGRDGRVRLDWSRVAELAGVFAGGLALSAAFLWPAVRSEYLVDFHVLRTKFVPWRSFVFPTFTAAANGVKWFTLQVPLPMVAFAGAGAGAVVLARRARDPAHRALGIAGVFAVGLTLILATELSYPLWLPDTPLRLVQFPFRWTMVPALLLPVLAPVAFTACVGWRRTVLGAAMLASLAAALALVAHLSTSGAHLDVATDRIGPYKGLPEYRILPGAPGYDAYVDAGLLPGECARLALTCSAMTQAGRGFDWSIAAARPTRVRLPMFAFPALATRVDGRAVPYARDAPTGTIALDLAPGAHRVRVEWHRLPDETLGLAVSAAAAALIGVAAFGRRRAPAEPWLRVVPA